jgi:S1-C subfamily serine protease
MFWHRSLARTNTVIGLAFLSILVSIAKVESRSSVRSITSSIIPATNSLALSPSDLTLSLTPNDKENLSADDLSKLGKQITVSIDCLETKRRNSGVIIDRQGNTYTVLTTRQITRRDDNFRLTTIDGIGHSFTDRDIRIASSDLDLAIVKFTSDRSYTVAKFGNSNNVREGSIVYKAGYTKIHESLASDLVYLFKRASLVSVLPDGENQKGYKLIDNNPLTYGSGGGAVLNSQGLLVGIQGLSFYDKNAKRFFGTSIPIDLYLSDKNLFTIAPNN